MKPNNTGAFRFFRSNRRLVGGGRRWRRGGVSLLEVLISIFVLTVGLLAVATLIPVGRFAVVEAAKSDRAAACGQAVLNDIKVRKMINPNSWSPLDGVSLSRPRPWCFGDSGAPGDPQTTVRRSGFELGESYAIDPFYASQASNAAYLTHFPYNIRDLGNPILRPDKQWRWTRMRRVTWTGVGLSSVLATGVFGWHDDLVIPVPNDETQRPRQMFFNGSTRGRAFPLMPGESAVRNPLGGQDSGKYSYLITVTPSAENHDFVRPNTGPPSIITAPYHYSENAPLYNVSVVVFYKRATSDSSEYLPSGTLADETPSERQVEVMFLGTGLGGGDVRLLTLHEDADDLDSDPDPREYLDIKENEWLMVSGGYNHYYQYRDVGGGSQRDAIPVGVHKWYRIIATGETLSEDLDGSGTIDPPLEKDYNNNGAIEWFREATLAGPDWNPLWGDWWGAGGPSDPFPLDGIPDLLFATLLDGVIGVYSTTVELEW